MVPPLGLRSTWPWLATLTWVLAVVAGFAILWRHAAGRGVASRAPVTWPAESRLHRAAAGATLLVFVHPHCPCSRATLNELGRLLGRVRGRVSAAVVLVRPDGVAPGWENGEIRELALRLRGVTTFEDDGGLEAQRFGASTSGATLLYGAGGALEFSGGLTSVRGHEGDSFGQERIVALLTTGLADRADSPVFGCPLLNDEPQKETP
jgi:hypothetical protein